MKEKELREMVNCGICGKPFGNSGVPMFWRIRIERFGINIPALKRQQCLGMMVGAKLAMAMGSDEDMTTPLMDPKYITVCENCCTKQVVIAGLAEDE